MPTIDARIRDDLSTPLIRPIAGSTDFALVRASGRLIRRFRTRTRAGKAGLKCFAVYEAEPWNPEATGPAKGGQT